MRFWDSSAVVPLVVEEERSAACRAVRRADRSMVVWMLSQTEVVSAVRRLGREGHLHREEVAAALRRLERLGRAWTEVAAVEATRERAERALGIHVLSAADALQLGAALISVRDRPRHRSLVTADDQLATAADAEGFDVIVPGS